MSLDELESSLKEINSLTQKDKVPAYLTLLASLTSPPNPRLLSHFLSAILSDSLAQIVARQVLSEYVRVVGAIEDREVRKDLMGESLTKMQSKITSFEEQVVVMREAYADLLEEDEEWSDAAKVLSSIPLESGNRTPDQKFAVYVRIVRLYLQEEDSTSATTYFNRASLLFHPGLPIEASLAFRLCQARMFDYSRRFPEAAQKYHELSFVGEIDEGERLEMLNTAITCAVLSPFGPLRNRILSSLYRDERSSSTPHALILRRMFLNQTIRPFELTSFESSLATHQLAKLPPTTAIVMPEGQEESGRKGAETVLDKAVLEHNVGAVSRVYRNISREGLGLALDLRPSAAEAMVREMIRSGRLRAQIDGLTGIITFEEHKAEEGGKSNVAIASSGADEEEEEDTGGEETRKWDESIRRSLQLIESVAGRCEALLAMGTQGIAPVKV